MTDRREIEAKFWKALVSDRTFMLGLDGAAKAHARPMTAILEDGHADECRGPVWCFTSSDTELARGLASPGHAFATFVSKDHDLFAAINGAVRIDNDPGMIERLWNPFVGAWFDGKDDPKVTLLRFDAEHAEIWLNEHSLLTGVKMLLGRDPKKDNADKVADIDL